MYPDDEDLPVLDYTKLRYALYVRKSTDDGEKQQRSLGDQIAECEIMARRLGIRLVKPYLVEKRSAKIPDQRPVFTQLMKDLREGTYDGIVAWHPDRLARNALESGVITHMVDTGVIKDLRFVTHYFTNDANGKLLLGMVFAFSKHYSDDLSQKVTRGVRRSFLEGKSAGTPKYGYLRDEQGIYRPDGRNFELICEAWRMRRQGATYAEIKRYLDSNGYGRRIKGAYAKRKGHVLKMSIQRLTDMFHDPFYYGVLMQAGKHIDLRAVPGYNFQPAVSEADWQSIQAMTSRQRNVKTKERIAFYPLRQMVQCVYCGRMMQVGASKSRRGTRYLYYRCDTKGCTRQPRSIRARKIFEWLYKFLGEGLPLTEEDYTRYHSQLVDVNDRKRQQLAIHLHSKQGALKAIERDINERSLAIVGYDKASTIWKVNNDKIEELATQRDELERDIQTIKLDMQKIEGNALSVEQFLNLATLAGSKLESAGPVAKDRICRILFLNLIVNTETVVDFTLREPFGTLIRTCKVQAGGPEATKLEPLQTLCEAILQHWDSTVNDQTDFANLLAAPYNVGYEY